MKQSHLYGVADNITLIEPSNEDEKKIKVAAYVRVSSSSEEQLHSFSQQISHYARLFRENEDKWEPVDIYTDEAITGTSATKREDFTRMLTDCRLGKIDRIITKSVSRFSRDNVVTLATIRELSSLGVSVCFEDDGIDTKSMPSEFILSLQGMVAEQGSKTISANLRKGFQIRAQRGEYTPAKKPYGYNIINRELVINEAEAKVVKRIFSDYLNGVSMARIARTLSQENIASPSGNAHWNRSTVRLILSNERALGDTKLQKKYSTDSFPITKKVNKGERDMYYISATHEAIIEPSCFEAVQVAIQRKSERIAEQFGNHPFNKMLRCSECGHVLRRKIVGKKAYWSCYARDKGDTHCTITQIPETEIENAFIRVLNKLKAGKADILLPMLSMLTELRVVKSQSNEKLAKISGEIREIREQSHMLNGLRSKGIIDSAFCLSEQNTLNRKLVALKKSREQILAEEESDDTLVQTKILLSYIEEDWPERATYFDAMGFKTVVQKVVALSQDRLSFTLINELTITEKIERRKK